MMTDLAFATYWSILASMGFDEYWDWRCEMAKKELHKNIDSYYDRRTVEELLELYSKAGVFLYSSQVISEAMVPHGGIRYRSGFHKFIPKS